MWKQWLSALLGLWVFAMPFIGMTGNALAWSLAISGLVIAGLSAWSAMETTPTTTEYSRDRERRYQAP